MRMYLVKQRNMASTDIRPTQGAVLELVQEVEGVEHKIFMDSHFTSLKLLSDVHRRKIMHSVQFVTTGRRCHQTRSL
jgi:hypothetical protein